MTDVGFTGGGAGSGMVYLAGAQSHKLVRTEGMIEHIVEQVGEEGPPRSRLPAPPRRRPRVKPARPAFPLRGRAETGRYIAQAMHPVAQLD